MKRLSTLSSLSREHHHVLKLAKRLREAPPGDEPAVARDFRSFWLDDGEQHLQREEQTLLGPYVEAGGSQATVDRLLAEHRQLRERAEHILTRMDEPSGACANCLSGMGELLRDHVRFEEREFFPELERTLSQEALQDVERQLLAA